MVSVDISLTPSLPGVSLPLSLSLNKRILGDFMGIMFFRQDSLKAEGRCHVDPKINTRPVDTAHQRTAKRKNQDPHRLALMLTLTCRRARDRARPGSHGKVTVHT